MALSLVVTLDLVVALVLAIPLASLAVSMVRVVALELAITLLRLTVALILTICLGLAVVSLGLAVVRLPGCAAGVSELDYCPLKLGPAPGVGVACPGVLCEAANSKQVANGSVPRTAHVMRELRPAGYSFDVVAPVALPRLAATGLADAMLAVFLAAEGDSDGDKSEAEGGVVVVLAPLVAPRELRRSGSTAGPTGCFSRSSTIHCSVRFSSDFCPSSIFATNPSPSTLASPPLPLPPPPPPPLPPPSSSGSAAAPSLVFKTMWLMDRFWTPNEFLFPADFFCEIVRVVLDAELPTLKLPIIKPSSVVLGPSLPLS
eukprot:CAMPEP_0119511862 /NCGR_PEP_ID=MMETSP1344-20130328/30397_1 /TAXON_ID=236787 /ORGANISM="Florenciella parvula, Strain CCMP2471" /LENGTH=315 /DNA_ID=CAMNT_0007548919 /DNA_START=168 /DNA_END=1112 /DNA_ORIENTATION=+